MVKKIICKGHTRQGHHCKFQASLCGYCVKCFKKEYKGRKVKVRF